MAEKRGLGRGLSALLGEVEETPVAGGEAAGLRTVPIELIRELGGEEKRFASAWRRLLKAYPEIRTQPDWVFYPVNLEFKDNWVGQKKANNAFVHDIVSEVI